MDAVAVLSKMPDADSVRRMEAHLLKLPQIDLSTSHVVHGGMCARTITIWPTELVDIDEIEDEMTDESAMLQTRREGIEYEQQKAIGV